MPFVVAFILILLGRSLAGKLTSKSKKTRTLESVSIVFTSLAILSLGMKSGSVALVIFQLVLFYFFVSVPQVTLSSALVNSVPENNRATFYSMVSTLSKVSSMAILFAISLFYETTKSIVAVVAIVAICTLLYLFRRSR